MIVLPYNEEMSFYIVIKAAFSERNRVESLLGSNGCIQTELLDHRELNLK